ncbi:hypothetical protein PV367_12615 [Streptomyces europaeiscabiei]|uniref:Uncharacterized protein n=1 Tax=Streptomyces europaeiscabiei TaxID=146819 RepID=A0AAJ2PNA8_9ACTN|nr:hypothetical protein [Streptomyces europaeiscabiei]MDX3130617.1 hypothetical protein [Streptomyces europaeiscabiei]
MTGSATYSPDGLRHDVADPATWSVRICAGRCGTCIFRPGNLMRLEEGRVAEMIAIAEEGHIVCHATLGTDAPAICAGFAAHRNGSAASLALRLARARVLRTAWVHVDARKVEA